MLSSQDLFGFHAIGMRLKTAPQSVIGIYVTAPKSPGLLPAFEHQPVQPSFISVVQANRACFGIANNQQLLFLPGGEDSLSFHLSAYWVDEPAFVRLPNLNGKIIGTREQ